MTYPIAMLAAADQKEPDESIETTEEPGEEELTGAGYLDVNEWPDEKLVKHLLAEWKSRNDEMRPRLMRWYVNRLRRGGDRWVGIKKSTDRNEIRIYTPPGGMKAPPTLGKAARLCRRLTAQMFQDPPTPEAIPTTDSDEDRSAAEFSSRLLQSMGSEASVNNNRLARRAFSKSHTYGSGFRHWFIDPYGGGQVPRRMMAAPDAMGEEDATQILPDPENGIEGAPRNPETFTPRMMSPEGMFTEDETEADQVWLPKLRGEVLTGQQVRMFPATATSIEDAAMVMILTWRTLGELRAQFEDVIEGLAEDELRKLVLWSPEGIDLKYLLPDHLTEEDVNRSREKPKHDTEDVFADHALVCTLTVYHKVCYDHPEGAFLVMAGPKTLFQRNPWLVERDGKRLMLDLPIDQIKGYDEGEDDPYGKGTMDFLGPGDELLANVDSAWITHFERFSNRKVFIPITSALQAKVAQSTMGTYVPINPGGKPEVEEIPNFPVDSMNLREKIVENMDDESGLQLTAQGVDSPYVQSGFHAVQVIEQVLAGLSELRQNVSDSLERGWRVQLQLIRAFYTVPQQTRFFGPDQEYKYDYWLASDLGSTTDVRVLRGTFSMMSPAMKSSIAVSMNQAGVLTPYELRRFTIGGTGGLIGVQDDPHWMRISRQIAMWQKGPEANQGINPFDPVPADQLMPVAQTRVEELGRAMAGTTYQKAPPEWRMPLDQAFQMAMMAAFPPPPPDPNAPPAAPDAAMAPPPDLAAPVDPTNPMPAPMLPVDDGGLPPDAGMDQGLPPSAGYPDVGVPQLDGTGRPALSLTSTPTPFAEL
jgi:hypothetical protein